ncbi:TPA: DUF916 and DUF3324 domain-containing protein [Enterococcus faecium]
MKKIITFVGLVSITIGNLICSPLIFASENHADFTVNAQQSTYQVDKQKTYFDLSLPINKVVPLTIQVTNNSNETISVSGKINPATTNLNGVVEYSKTKDKLTGKQPIDITKIAKFEKETQTIEPKQTINFVVNVTVPTKNYSGVVAGGITLRDVTEKKEDEKHIRMFKNKFAYAIALILHGEREPIKTELALKDVIPDQVNNRNVLIAEITNESTNYFNKVSIEANVIDSNNKQILWEKKENMQIAPSSIFQFPLYYAEEKMQEGTYILKMVVKSNEQEWDLSKKFVIQKDAANKLNQTDIVQNSDRNTNIMVYIIIGLIVLFICLVIIIFILFKKRK